MKTTHRLNQPTPTGTILRKNQRSPPSSPLIVGDVGVKKTKNKRSADFKSKYNQSSPHIEDFRNSSTSKLQMNSQAIANKKAYLVDLINKEKPDVLCIQETMLSKQTSFNLKN